MSSDSQDLGQLVTAINGLQQAVQNNDDVADELTEIRRVLEDINNKMNMGGGD